MNNHNKFNTSTDPTHEEYANPSDAFEKDLIVGELSGSNGFKYPKYRIGNREVVFRNRNEAVNFDEDAISIDHHLVSPLPSVDLDEWNTSGQLSYIEPAEFINFKPDTSDNPEATIIATNTPEGVLSVAALSADNPEYRKRSSELLDELVKGPPFEHLDDIHVLLDEIYAACEFNHSGEKESFTNHEGIALVAEARSGNTLAQEELDIRRKAYYELIDSTESQEARLREEEKIRFHEQTDAEALPVENIALVHSTSYPIERDDNGNITLYPAGAKREDGAPRASVHFTLNSQIIQHEQAGKYAWSNSNRLIVANLSRAIDNNSKPRSMKPVDTYFLINPGEHLTLPDAIIVEPTHESEKLLEKSDSEIKYFESPQYNDEQVREIKNLSSRYSVIFNPTQPNDTLREIALRIAEEQLGVSEFATVAPGAHGLNESDINRRIALTAYDNDVSTRTHFNSPEQINETLASKSLSGGAFSSDGEPGSTFIEAGKNRHLSPRFGPIESNRTIISLGHMAARPPQNRNPKLKWDIPGEGLF